MIERNTEYYKNGLKKQEIEKRKQDSSYNFEMVNMYKKTLSLIRKTYVISYVLFALFTLAFILSKVFVGGFYYGNRHSLAIWFLMIGSTITVIGIVLMIVFALMHKKIGSHFMSVSLYLITLIIALLSMHILGISAYLTVAIASSAVIFIIDVLLRFISTYFNKDAFVWWNVGAIFLLLLSALTLLVPAPYNSKNQYVETRAYSRTVRYVIDDDEVALDKVMLTAFDALRIKKDVTFEVDHSVRINGSEELVTKIGEHAFDEVGSFEKVRLPGTVKVIESGAFDNSSVKTLFLSNADVTIGDVFTGSELKEVYINGDKFDNFKFEGEIPSDVIVYVDREYIDEFRILNPELRFNAAPMIGENELCVSFSTIPEAGSTDFAEEIHTEILTKNEDGTVSVKVPYSEYLIENARYGKHWCCIAADGNVYRMFSFKYGDETVTPGTESITVSKNSLFTGEWIKMHYVYADLTEFGADQ